jgi:galactokinase
MDGRKVQGRASGRVELLGNHTDYNEGLVLGAAIDRGLTLTGFARPDGVIHLRSAALQRKLEIPLSSLAPSTEEPWANYALGVVEGFVRAGHQLCGFEAEIGGELPAGAGLSSSAAYEVATARFLMQLFEIEMAPLEVAKLCQRAENQFVGVQSGLLDQVTSIFGRANHLVYIDCRTEEIRTIPFPADLSLLVAVSGVKHDLTAGHYNARRTECFAARDLLGVAALRDASSALLAAQSEKLSPSLLRRARHVVGETERVSEGVAALDAGDVEGFGRLMYSSHESSRVDFENSVPELDLLVEIARQEPGVLGARLTGGGFGGATVTLVRTSAAPRVAERIRGDYLAATQREAAVFLCKIAGEPE